MARRSWRLIPWIIVLCFPFSEKIITADIVSGLAEVAAALAKITISTFRSWTALNPAQAAQAIANNYNRRVKKPLFLSANMRLSHPQAAAIRALARLIAD